MPSTPSPQSAGDPPVRAPDSRPDVDGSPAADTARAAPRGLLGWQVGYLGAWAVSILAAGAYACLYVDPPMPKDLSVRIGLTAGSECSDSGLSGQVTLADVPVEGADVSIAVRDPQGRVLDAFLVQTGEGGYFSRCIAGQEPHTLAATATIPLSKLASHPALTWHVKDMVDACAAPGWRQEPCCNRVRGVARFEDSPGNAMTRLRLRVPRWLFVGGIGSLLLGLYASILGAQRLGVLASIALSLATVFVAMGMLGIILTGYIGVLWNHQEAGVVFQTPLGYLTQGTFHPDVADDWLFSLTLPEKISGETTRLRGFGAPMWTILLATIGACIIALQNLIRTPFDLDEKDGFARRNELNGHKADHLFTVVFAPLGAIYVYQTLLELGITRTVPVAAIMLASGLALNHLVTLASRRVKDVIGRAMASQPATPAEREVV